MRMRAARMVERLWRRDAPALAAVHAQGGIVLKDAEGARCVPLALATGDIGAALAGVAAPMLGTAVGRADEAIEGMKAVIEDLRIAMSCTGSADLAALRRARPGPFRPTPRYFPANVRPHAASIHRGSGADGSGS